MLAWDNLAEVLGGDEFPYVHKLLEMAQRAHSLGHRGLVLSLRVVETTPSYVVRVYRLLASRLKEMGRK